MKIEFENFRFEIPPPVYRYVAVISIALAVLGGLYYSRGANVETDVSTHGVKARFEQPKRNSEIVEVKPTPKIGEEPQAQNTPVARSQDNAQQKETLKIKKRDDYFYIYERAQGDAEEDDEYVLMRRRCVPGMPICTLSPAERKLHPLIED